MDLWCLGRRWPRLYFNKLKRPFYILLLLSAVSVTLRVISVSSVNASEGKLVDISLQQLREVGGNANHSIAVENIPEEPKHVSPGSCDCGGDPYELWDKIENSAVRRRKRELEEWERYNEEKKDPVVQCQASSPLRYVASGITVEPFETIHIGGFKLDHDNDQVRKADIFKLSLTSTTTLGMLFLSQSSENMKHGYVVTGNLSSTLTAQTATVEGLENILHNLHYRSMIYDIDKRDYVHVKLNNFTFSFIVHIKRSSLPFLYDPGEYHHISNLVTVITKTFERYNAVEKLIRSIRKFYPGITIIVADDSEHPQRLKGKNLKHYIMPFAEGTSAGRNLALSQVRTKYFLYVDDDFIFTKGTKLENFIEKLEDITLKVDLIGGTFGDADGNRFPEDEWTCSGCCSFDYGRGNTGGNCLVRTCGRMYDWLDRYPQCHFTDMTTMFFMGRTTAVRQVGFDPSYERLGHTEYFFDWMGHLRVVSCSDVNLVHERIENYKYNEFRSRRVDPTDQMRTVKHSLFKNNLKCFKLQ
ncbi:beta-1,4 N-acetylgalactosaminyltransferase 1-like [Glandiceps talaboti]